MIEGGYILQPRIFDDSEASHFPPVTRELWFYLLRKVNHARNERLNLDRGQGFFRFEDIQNDLSWFSGYRKNVYSKPQLTKSLRRLCERNMTATMKATRGIIITVCNYELYQNPKNYEGNNEESTKELRRNLEGNTINKNDTKNAKNENKGINGFAQKMRPDWISEKDFNDLISHKKKNKGSITERTITTTISELLKSKDHGLNIKECVDEYLGTAWTAYKHDWILNRLSTGKVKGGQKTFAQIRDENNMEACREFANE